MRQCFAWWSFTYRRPEVEPRAVLAAAARAGMEGVEMLPTALRPVAADLGLVNVTVKAGEIGQGFNDRARHLALSDRVRRAVEDAAKAGIACVVVLSGDRAPGLSDEDGIAACADGLAPLAAEAASSGVTLLLELLNSKLDHPGYHADRSDWAAAVVTRAGSPPGLKLLFDAYYMQIMEGDLIRTVERLLPMIGHVHTAGVPGRRDLDDEQEVHWRGIAGALQRLGYAGWVGHEFVPKGDPAAALAHAAAQFR